MNAKKILNYTLIISIAIQIFTFLISIYGIFTEIPVVYHLIKDLFFLELFVQLIEGVFYIWLAFNVLKLTNITPKRYFDWMITTPTMLITLISYLIFINAKETNQTQGLTLYSILTTNSNVIIPILLLNWAMLLFGYLGEIKVLPVLYSIILGFIPFAIYYAMIYSNFVKKTNDGYIFFFYFLFFWSLYGFVAALPYYAKNTLYNILDLFAKNFFGLFLAYIIYTGNY
jgi:hypothetical protein